MIHDLLDLLLVFLLNRCLPLDVVDDERRRVLNYRLVVVFVGQVGLVVLYDDDGLCGNGGSGGGVCRLLLLLLFSLLLLVVDILDFIYQRFCLE